MILWLQLHLHDGAINHSQFLTEKSFRMMLASSVPRTVHTTQPVTAFQALGWSGLVIDGVTLYGHGGHDNGFRANVLFVPDAHVGLVLMTNGDGPKVNVDGLAIKLAGILLGRNWSRLAQDAESGSN
jgi:CubicO group peptidase (beta-lactamase class C family)